METTDINPITAFQIQLQMVHRIVALLILVAVAFCAWSAWRRRSGPIAKWSAFWLGLIFCQACLGAATILTDKAADVATTHVLVGALSLATGAALSIIAFRFPALGLVSTESKASRAQNVNGVMDVGPAGELPAAR